MCDQSVIAMWHQGATMGRIASRTLLRPLTEDHWRKTIIRFSAIDLLGLPTHLAMVARSLKSPSKAALSVGVRGATRGTVDRTCPRSQGSASGPRADLDLGGGGGANESPRRHRSSS